MTTTTTETRTRTKADDRRGFPGLRCLKCGEEDTVRVNVADMGLTCSSCDEGFSVAEVRDMMASWTRVLAWIDQAPAVK
jgi:hypothetical protein